VVFRGRDEQRPWHLVLVPQPEGITLWGTIDPLGLHHLTVYHTGDAVARLEEELPQGSVAKAAVDGAVEERVEEAEEAALISAVRFSDVAPISSDDLMVIRAGADLEVLRRVSKEDSWHAATVDQEGLMGLIREMAAPLLDAG
jgi:hypothetical protein